MVSRIMDEIEFENRINELGDSQLALIKFVARQQFASSKLLALHESKITSLENGDRKLSSIAGGITGTITAIIIAIINYFVSKRS